MTIPVVWASYRKPEIIARGYMDEGQLERLFDRRDWRPPGGVTFEHYDGFDALPPDTDGAVVVLPAQHHIAPSMVAKLNADLARLDWCVLVLAGDECSLFVWDWIDHPHHRLWIMTPLPQIHGESLARFIGEGYGYPDTPDTLAAHADAAMAKPTPWFFAGQITHRRRKECAQAMDATLSQVEGRWVQTQRFMGGMPRDRYLAALAEAKIAPCPAGPGTPDSFRLYEALEAGALPLADAVTPDGWTGYWPMLCGGEPPFPVIDDWSTLPQVMRRALDEWPGNVNRASAWWQNRKRDMAWWLEDDIAALRGVRPEPSTVADRVTVLIPTSPIPSHPSTAVIEETIDSVRAQPDLADAEIVVMIDGVRPEQDERRPAYDEYVRRLLWLTNHHWRNVVPMLADEWLHQANLTRRALDLVRTSLVLFVEHDTPLCGPVPWGELADAIELCGGVNLVRLHHEAQVLDVHQHLMVDHVKRWDRFDVPLLRTMQWSQRPHLASADWYRSVLARYFGADARTMVEDCLHGPVDYAWRTKRMAGWEEWRLALFAPKGDMKRSLHTDGREGEPKFDFTFAYDGETPEGAPFPSALRTPEPAA